MYWSNNEGETGHFVYQNPNMVADTYNVYRTNGAPASIKLWTTCNSYSSMMKLGRAPNKGLLFTPASSGLKTLKIHIAYKGYTNSDDLFARFIVSATTKNSSGEEMTYYSTMHGRLVDDSSAEWNNDSDLVQKCFEIPMEIFANTPINICVDFAWYSASGFVYLDPLPEIV